MDEELIEALYKASQVGVQCHLIVRGLCALRPQLEGLSENIYVFSVVDSFLEHSRIYAFIQNQKVKVYIGSSDWMDRNMDRRVEVVVPILSRDLEQRIYNDILLPYLKDNTKSRILRSNGQYEKQQLKKMLKSLEFRVIFCRK